ncbi:MAG: OmpA family protein [Helicobacter sp.]|nr:OmpA family protein [Helicobacter sp.]
MKKLLLSVCAALFIVACAQQETAEDQTAQIDPFQEQATTQEQSDYLADNEPLDNVQELGQSDTTATDDATNAIPSGSVIGRVYFDYDKYNIRSDMQDVVINTATIINQDRDINVIIEGNTDEFGTDEYNLALGNRRALTIKSALSTSGVDPNIIRTISLGKSKPVCFNKTNQCYQENRRGDVKIIR